MTGDNSKVIMLWGGGGPKQSHLPAPDAGHAGSLLRR